MIRTSSLLILGVIWILISCGKGKDDTLRIAAASNTAFAMEEIVERFEDLYDVDCELIISSSGKLTHQIIGGAPFNVFISADTVYPTEIVKYNLNLGNPMVYAEGSVSLWSKTPIDSTNWIRTLFDPEKTIAMANPDFAPYGSAAKEIIANLDLDNPPEIVYGESISQINQYIVSESVDMAFTSKSVTFAPKLSEKQYWMDIPSDLYQPIIQALVAVNLPDNNDKTGDFIRFMKTTEANEIMRKYGYKIKSVE